MHIVPDSPTGRRLRRHGVSSNALAGTRIYRILWLPGGAITVPFPFRGTVILIRRRLLRRDADGELADGPELAPLVHQLCHAHQRLEWGLTRYLWRHLWARVRRHKLPIRFSQVERECHRAARQTVESYRQESRPSPGQGRP